MGLNAGAVRSAAAGQLSILQPTAGIRKPKACRVGHAQSGEPIYELISAAILEHRLLPGTKLVEERLAKILGASRTRIREVLARLARERLVEQVRQRGAYVASPSVERARDVLEARRVIEPAVFKGLIDTLSPVVVERLRGHIQREADAHLRGDQRAVIRLSGEFHTLAADLAGNAVLARILRELTSVTGLAILLYARTAQACSREEHIRIVEAIARRDQSGTQAMVEHHLRHIEAELGRETLSGEADLETIFSPHAHGTSQ